MKKILSKSAELLFFDVPVMKSKLNVKKHPNNMHKYCTPSIYPAWNRPRTYGTPLKSKVNKSKFNFSLSDSEFVKNLQDLVNKSKNAQKPF